jgi:ATP/ADP translocase
VNHPGWVAAGVGVLVVCFVVYTGVLVRFCGWRIVATVYGVLVLAAVVLGGAFAMIGYGTTGQL